MKIDTHIHLSMKTSTGPNAMTISGYQDMLPHMKQLGIQKAVLMSAGETGMAYGSSNEENRAIVQADPKHFAWVCNLDPVSPETIYDRLRTYKEQGAVGIGEVMLHRSLEDPFFSALFEAAGALELPVTFHMSPEQRFSYGVVDEPGLPMLEKCLQRFPKTIFVGHSQPFWIEISGDAPTDPQNRNRPGKSKIIPGGRLVSLFSDYPNLYGDLSANSGGQAMMRDPSFSLAFLEKWSDRLFYATDMVNTEMVFPLGKWLDEQMNKGALSRAAWENICFKNAKAMYKL